MKLYRKIKFHLQKFPQKQVIDLIAKYFQDINDKIPSYEFRPLQVTFAYEAVTNALKQKQTVISLGCGEGKQDAFAVAVKVYANMRKNSKILFLSATKELLIQMKNSPLFKNEKVTILDETDTYSAQNEIFFCDYRTFLHFSLMKKLYLPNILDEIDIVFADEFHYFLTSSDYIISSSNNKAEYSVISEIIKKQKLLETVKKEYEKDKTLITHGDYRFSAKIAQKKLNGIYEKTKHLVKKDIFLKEINTIATALAKELGKDYYFHTQNGEIVSYSCADVKSAKPSYKTVFSDKNLALYIALKHIKPLKNY